MTTHDNNQDENNGKFKRMLDGIQSGITDIGSVVREISEGVTELVERTDTIYDAVTYHRDSATYGHDDFLNESDN